MHNQETRAFLIPYAIFLFLCGLPLFMLEVSIGQFSGKSPVVVWSISPFFRGLGFLMMCVSGLVSWYYNTIMAWTIYFFVHSFFPSIPWSSCNNWWNTDVCITRRGLLKGLNETAVNINNTFQTTTLGVAAANSSKYSTAAYEFWEYNVLRRSAGIDYMGSVQWHLVAVMAGAWLLTCLCLVKGVHSVGKVVYVTVTLPYILFTVLLIRGLTLEGSLDGIIHYVKPSFHDMFKFGAWRDAATQVFFSLGPMWGGIITMSSYNKFHNKCIRDAIYGTIADGLTSFYAGFVIFALLGVIVHDSGLTMDDIPISGPELLFIVYPEILASMPLPNVWSVLFFLMLLTVGIDSQFGMLETVSSGLIDAFPERLGKRRVLTTIVLCLGFFVLSMPYTTNGGYYLLQLMDWYASAFCVMLGAFLECIVVAWVYGAERFSRDIELMTGAGVGMIVRFAWCIITPLIMIVMILLAIVGLSPPSTDDYAYPGFAHVVGIIIAIIPCLPVPFGMIYGLLKKKGSFYKRLKLLLSPSHTWKPNDPQLRTSYKMYQYEGTWIENIRTNLLGSRKRNPELTPMYTHDSDVL